jgi:iron complex outermembrane receptor protein
MKYVSSLTMKILSPLLWVCLMALPTYGQTGKGTISGRLTTTGGQPAAYVNVALQGTRYGTTTDESGRFVLKAPAGAHTLIASAVGFVTQEKPVQVTANQTVTVDFILTENNTQLTEVIVTGSKTDYVVVKPSESLRLNAPLIEVPQNISVVTQQTIRDFGIVGTAEMARLTSGVVRRYGGANDFAFTIRGTDATNNVFRNGVGGYWWNQQSDAFMIERVEFVKGPAGFMIGNSEPGGLLNEVTKQADGRRIREAELGYGSWNLMRGGVDIGDRFSPNSRFSYRVVAGGQHTNANYDFYRASRLYVMPSLRYTYKEGSFIQAEMIRMDGFVKADNYNNVSPGGADERLFPLTFNSTDPNAVRGVETDDTYLRLSHTHRLGRGWQIKTQLADVRGVYRGDYMYVTGVSARFDTLFRQYGYTDWRNRLQAAQTFVDGKFRTGNSVEHSVLAGLDYGKSWVSSAWGEAADQDTIFGNDLPLVVRNPVYGLNRGELAPTVTLNPSDEWGTEWMALYAQDHIKLFNKLVVTVAGRLSRTRAWASYDSATVRNVKFTPRFGLTYLIKKNMSAYALYDETFLPQTGRKRDGSARPLTGSNMEIGFKSQWMNQRLAFNASLFRTVKNNVLVQDPLNTNFYEERGQVTSQGFEMDITGNLTNHLMINANYTYTDARITKDAVAENVGFPNYGVANHTGNAMLRYRFLSGGLNGFSAGVGVQLMGRRAAVWPGWTDVRDKAVTSPAYTLLDANVGYDREKFSIRANVFNLTNRQGMDNATWNSATDAMPGFFTFSPLQPVNFRVMASYKF